MLAAARLRSALASAARRSPLSALSVAARVPTRPTAAAANGAAGVAAASMPRATLVLRPKAQATKYEVSEGWISRALQQTSRAKHRNIAISPRKLNDICFPVRRLHVDEALTQLRLSKKRKAALVFNCIRNARTHAINNFRMDPARLLVDTIVVNKGVHLQRLDIKARGRHGIKRRYRSQLKVVLREIPPQPGETRLGKAGPKHVTKARTVARLQAMGVTPKFISQSPAANYPRGAPAPPFASPFLKTVPGAPRPEYGWYQRQPDFWMKTAKAQQQPAADAVAALPSSSTSTTAAAAN